MIVKSYLQYLTVFLSIYCAFSQRINVTKAFIDNEIVPDILSCPPVILAKVTLNDGTEVNPGDEVSLLATVNRPQIISWDAESDKIYSVAMYDADVPSRITPLLRPFKHYLVVNIPGTDISKGETLADYLSPTPPCGTGLHRYIFMVFLQPNGTIKIKKPLAEEEVNRAKSSIEDFAKEFGLELLAGNFYVARCLNLLK